MLRKICGLLTGILIICLAILAGILIGPRLFGFQSLAVLSGSMEPEIGVGAIVFAKESDLNDIVIGDVITYRITGSTMVTHRVADIDQSNQQFYTKGDANDVMDVQPVPFDNIVGKVAFSVPYIGYMSIYAKTPLGIVAICTILIILIILTFLPEIFSDNSSNTASKKNTVDED